MQCGAYTFKWNDIDYKDCSIMMMKLLVVVAFAFGSSLGFAPAVVVPSSLSSFRSASTLCATTRTTTRTIHFSSAMDDIAMTDNDFTTYSISNPLQQLAYQDTVIGDGDTIESGKVVTVAYEGRLMSNGYKFDFGTGYAFRFGQGKVIPGWEVGLVVRISYKQTIKQCIMMMMMMSMMMLHCVLCILHG